MLICLVDRFSIGLNTCLDILCINVRIFFHLRYVFHIFLFHLSDQSGACKSVLPIKRLIRSSESFDLYHRLLLGEWNKVNNSSSWVLKRCSIYFQGSWLEYLLKCGAIEIFINSVLCCYITKFYVDFCLCAQGSNNVVKDKKEGI